jgi:hypothetical protein
MSKQKNKTTKIVGYVDKKIAYDNNIIEYAEKDIVQSTKLDIHTNKHAADFFSIDSYHNTLININEIIKNPYYVEYDSKKDSLKYYGKVDQYVCVIVKIKEKKNYIFPHFTHKVKKKLTN